MWYLSNRIAVLVNALQTRRGSIKEAPEASEMGFEVDACEQGKVVEQSLGLVPRSVIRQGSSYAYVVASGIRPMSAQEARIAEGAKGAVIDALAKSEEEIGMRLFGRARDIACDKLSEVLGKERADYIAYLIAHDTVGFGPISVLMEDREHIEEIEINAPRAPISIFHASYGRCSTNLKFRDERRFRHALNKLIYETDKELGEGSPIIDAQVEGARIHAQMRPYATSGAVASIRLAGSKVVGIDYLAKRETTSFDVLAYLWMAMDSGRNMLVAGSPASGKTTLMSALLSFVPISERIVTIEEDVNELKAKIDINNSVAICGSRYGGSVSTRDQVINALRMRPDRLVVGEVRGEETRELFSGANLGIPFMTTMHSSSGGADILKKLVVKPMCVEARSLSMLDVAVYMRHLDASKRLLSEVYEYRWLSRAETDKLGIEIEGGDSVDVLAVVGQGKIDSRALAGSKVIESFAKKRGITSKAALKEHARRAEFLKVTCESSKGTDEAIKRIQEYGL